MPGPRNLTGAVVRYYTERGFGFIRPDAESDPLRQDVFFHYAQGSLGSSVRRVSVPVPQQGDRVRYVLGLRNDGRVCASKWVFADIQDRLCNLTPDQHQLVQQILGPAADQWEIWNALDELPAWNRYPGREHFKARRWEEYADPSNLRVVGTLGQVLLRLRYDMAEQNLRGPALPRLPDLPYWVVKGRGVDGQWRVNDLPQYTQVQAEALAQRLRRQYDPEDVQVFNLWPDAPPLTPAEAAKVIGVCHRRPLQLERPRGPELKWVDRQWVHPLQVASGYFGDDGPWLQLGGHLYQGEDARWLQPCGIP